MNDTSYIPNAFSIKPLFKNVFGSEISDTLLNWKYNGNRGFNIGFWNAEDTLIGHVGGVYRIILYKGVSYSVPQMTDLMVSPSKVNGLSRSNSVFGNLIKYYMKNLKNNYNPLAITFGFPSARAMKAGTLLGMFGCVDSIFELIFTASPKKWHSDRCISIDKSKSSDDIQKLWLKMKKDFKNEILGIRDLDYLKYRYFEHPENKYLYYFITPWWSNKPLGIAFLKTYDLHVELMDIICEKKNIIRIINALKVNLPILGKESMHLWLCKRYASKLKSLAKSINETQFKILANPLNENELKDIWWLTSGDTEYR